MEIQVLVVGGSNSIKYTPYVRHHFEGRARVNRVPDNARSTRYTLERIDDWLGSGNWNVIHCNWGMHDLTRIDGVVPQIPLQEYEENLRRLLLRLGKVGEKLIWANTMFMMEELQPRRRIDDVRVYNRAAESIVRSLRIPVHDLFRLTSERQELFGPDGLHFTDEGYRVLGQDVGMKIASVLE